MIFVTVGTHEQGLERLLVELDNLIENGSIKEEVFAQIGYSSYKPRNYQYKKMIGYSEMDSYVQKARIVITHGGPGSIFHPLQYGKIPIVVPRDPNFNEHVDNHQILFTTFVTNRYTRVNWNIYTTNRKHNSSISCWRIRHITIHYIWSQDICLY